MFPSAQHSEGVFGSWHNMFIGWSTWSHHFVEPSSTMYFPESFRNCWQQKLIPIVLESSHTNCPTVFFWVLWGRAHKLTNCDFLSLGSIKTKHNFLLRSNPHRLFCSYWPRLYEWNKTYPRADERIPHMKRNFWKWKQNWFRHFFGWKVKVLVHHYSALISNLIAKSSTNHFRFISTKFSGALCLFSLFLWISPKMKTCPTCPQNKCVIFWWSQVYWTRITELLKHLHHHPNMPPKMV